MADVFYSVGQNTTDHKTGSPTVTIASGVATFSVAQTATNMGVGDKITHAGGDGICYISGKTSTSVWTVVTKTGGTPTNVTAQSVTSIAHEYTSMSAAEAGASDANHLNTQDLVTNTFTLYLPCYRDDDSDGNAVTFDSGWVTSAVYKIFLYTPDDTATECNQSQRHAGVWDWNKFAQELSSGTTTISFAGVDYFSLEGLQVTCSGTFNYGPKHSGTDQEDAHHIISHNIIKYTGSGSGNGIEVGQDCKICIFNNVVYDWVNGDGIKTTTYDSSVYAFMYANTVYGCDNGYNLYGNPSNTYNHIKDNIGNGNTAADYVNTNIESDNTSNISEDATSPDVAFRNKAVTFVNEASDDFRLDTTDTVAKNLGANLTADSDCPITDDIAGTTRPQGSAVDIGAFEVIEAAVDTLTERTYPTGIARGVGIGVA